jgi:hypothetical protein
MSFQAVECRARAYVGPRWRVSPALLDSDTIDLRILIEASNMSEEITTQRSVFRLALEKPDWIPVLKAACSQARRCAPYGGEFAGSWVLREMAAKTGAPPWRPGLRLLVAYGLLEKSGESTRGGRRAYYRMPDPDGVEQALTQLPADMG